MLWQRIASALIAGPLVLWAVYAGGWPFMLLLACVAVFAWKELQLMQPHHEAFLLWLGWLLLLLLLYTTWRWPEQFLPLFTLAIFTLLAALLWRYETTRWSTITHTVSSFCYLALPLVHLVKLGSLTEGWQWIILLLVCVWSYDSFAFFAGCRFGRCKPWAHISPNKSLEGVAGGLLGSTLVSTLAFALLLPELGWGQLAIYSLPFGLCVGVLAQTGDLLESALKRAHAIKDSGRFLPGHGGLLDRIDSVLFTTPFVYYFLVIFVL